MPPRGKLGILAATVVAAVAGVTAFASPAGAQTQPAQVAPATAYTWFQISNTQTGDCIQEDGTTSAVYTGGCSSNDSDYWRWTAAGMLLNEHSGLCITSTSTGPGEYMDSCSNNSVQIWHDIDQTYCNVAGWYCVILENNHTGDQLAEGSGNALTQVAVGNAYSQWYIGQLH